MGKIPITKVENGEFEEYEDLKAGPERDKRGKNELRERERVRDTSRKQRRKAKRERLQGAD